MNREPMGKELEKFLISETNKLFKKQLNSIVSPIKRELAAAGVDSKLVAKALNKVAREEKENYARYRLDHTRLIVDKVQMSLRAEFERNLKYAQRNQDPLGRLIIHFGLMNPTVGNPCVHPDGSEEDEACREAVIRGVVPRPFLRCFLISVRGSLRGVNKCSFKPMVLGQDDLEEKHGQCLALLRRFKESDPLGREIINWDAALIESEVKDFTLGLISLVLSRISLLGAKRYLRVMDNIQATCDRNSDQMRMLRPFSPDDLRALLRSLSRSKKALEKELQKQAA